MASDFYLERMASSGDSGASVEVYRDGSYVGDLDADGAYSDLAPTSDPSTYELALTVLPTDEGAEEETATTSFSLVAEAQTLLDGFAPQASNNHMQVQYKTFIPNRRVTAPGTACRASLPWTTLYFGGDNRGYSASSSKFRTRTNVQMNFTTKRITLSKFIGTTNRYPNNTSNVPDQSATEAGKNIYFKKTPKINSSSASYRLYHSSGNPLCWLGGSVWYEVEATIYKNGSASIYGYRLRAPNHEMYIKGSSGSWQTVMRRDSKSFVCLVINLNCGVDEWTAYFNKKIF